MIKHFVTPAVAADIMLQARGQHAPNKKKNWLLFGRRYCFCGSFMRA